MRSRCSERRSNACNHNAARIAAAVTFANHTQIDVNPSTAVGLSQTNNVTGTGDATSKNNNRTSHDSNASAIHESKDDVLDRVDAANYSPAAIRTVGCGAKATASRSMVVVN